MDMSITLMRSFTSTFSLEAKVRTSWRGTIIPPGFPSLMRMVSKRLILSSPTETWGSIWVLPSQIPDMRRIFVLQQKILPCGGNLNPPPLPSPPTPPSYADVRPVRWWFCNYWWLHISSELLQSVDMVIVKEVICIKLIIPRNKAHKSGHYQFSGKCFKLTLLCWVQGKKKRGKDSLILPNQGSNLSERTKPCLTQWLH